MTKKELNQLVADYKEFKVMEKEIKAELERREALLKKEMEKKGVTELAVGDSVVRNTPFVQKRFDSKGFKAENPEMYEKFVREVAGTRFMVA